MNLLRNLSLGIIFASCSLGWAYEPISLPWYNSDEVGEIYSMKDHPESFFVLHFYWYQCAPSHYAEEQIIALADEFSLSPRIKFLDISADFMKKYYDLWLERHEQTHPLLADKDRKFFKLWDVRYAPTVIIADANGKEYFRYVGVLGPDNVKEIKDTLVELIL